MFSILKTKAKAKSNNTQNKPKQQLQCPYFLKENKYGHWNNNRDAFCFGFCKKFGTEECSEILKKLN
jgi:hypothetical protein